MAYASVYPLVTARSVARPFTYEVPDEVGPGAVVQVRFGNATRRGVVVEVAQSPPEGIEAAPIEKVVDEVPAPLVDLALWIAGYYGSTPARALELIAPLKRTARAERPRPAERDALGGEARPAALSPSQEKAVGRIVGAMDEGLGANFLLYGATGSGKTEVYLQACEAALERGLGAIVLVPEIGLTPQAVGRFEARFGDRIAILHSALGDAERRDERVRIDSGEARVVIGARSAVFAPIKRARPDLRGRGARRVVQAGVGSALRRADGGGEARLARRRGRGVRQRDAPSRELGAAGAARSGRPAGGAASARARRRPPLREGLSALGPAAGGTGSGGGARREGDPAAEPPRSRPALHCRACGKTIRCPNCDVSLVLHRDGRLRCHHCGFADGAPETCPSCGSAELARLERGPSGSSESSPRSFPSWS